MGPADQGRRHRREVIELTFYDVTHLKMTNSVSS
jgi:hypothetical protein